MARPTSRRAWNRAPRGGTQVGTSPYPVGLPGGLLEREVWDMFGVKFADRPDIKRLLMYEEFVGHPLRKDYPINKRQPLIGPKAEPENPVNLNKEKQRVEYE